MTHLPPPPPAPAAPPAPVGPGKPRRTLRTVLIVVGIVLLVCCGVGVAGGIYAYRTASNAIESVQAGAKTFFDTVVSGGPGAYDLLCSNTKASISRKEFDDDQAGNRLRSYAITGTNVSSVNGRTTTTLTVQLTFRTRTETHSVPMVSEDGTWKVCGLPY